MDYTPGIMLITGLMLILRITILASQIPTAELLSDIISETLVRSIRIRSRREGSASQPQGGPKTQPKPPRRLIPGSPPELDAAPPYGALAMPHGGALSTEIVVSSPRALAAIPRASIDNPTPTRVQVRPASREAGGPKHHHAPSTATQSQQHNSSAYQTVMLHLGQAVALAEDLKVCKSRLSICSR